MAEYPPGHRYAALDLAHFTITLSVVLAGFAIAGWLTFGTTDPEFSSVGNAFLTVYKMANGEFDMRAMENTGGNLGLLYYIMFTLLVVFIMVNVFLAIVLNRARPVPVCVV